MFNGGKWYDADVGRYPSKTSRRMNMHEACPQKTLEQRAGNSMFDCDESTTNGASMVSDNNCI